MGIHRPRGESANGKGNGTVEPANSAKEPVNEYSPTFLPSLDPAGNRLRLQDAATWTLMLSISGKL